MTQLILFDSEPDQGSIKRDRHQFDSHDLAARFAIEARGSGKYSDVFIVKVLDKSVVILESET